MREPQTKLGIVVGRGGMVEERGVRGGGPCEGDGAGNGVLEVVEFGDLGREVLVVCW